VAIVWIVKRERPPERLAHDNAARRSPLERGGIRVGLEEPIPQAGVALLRSCAADIESQGLRQVGIVITQVPLAGGGSLIPAAAAQMLGDPGPRRRKEIDPLGAEESLASGRPRPEPLSGGVERRVLPPPGCPPGFGMPTGAAA
jgi:hypothetical protein